MKVIVSPASLDEVEVVLEEGADVLDLKNPAEGSLGAPLPCEVRSAAALARRRRVPLSVALGDLAFRPGTAALAAFGAACAGAEYVKVGLHEVASRAEATALLEAVVQAVRAASPDVRVVAAGYADRARCGGLAPGDLVRAARASGCRVALLDTAVKDGRSLLDVLEPEDLREFTRAARAEGLHSALSGSLRVEHLSHIARAGPDFVGVRGGVCEDGERRGRISRARLRAFLAAARRGEAG